jgi:hypothetical protein
VGLLSLAHRPEHLAAFANALAETFRDPAVIKVG